MSQNDADPTVTPGSRSAAVPERWFDTGAQRPQLTYRRFLAFAALAVMVALAPVLLWRLSDIVLLAFGAVLIATLLRVVAEPFERWTPLPSWLSLMISGLIVIGLVGAAAWVFGSEIATEFSDITRRIETAAREIRGMLDKNEAGKYLVAQMQGPTLSVTGMLQRVFSLGTSVLEALVVVVISALYLVVQPQAYRRGIVLLFPPRMHKEAEDTLDEIGRTLRLWLIGQITQMLIIGGLSTLAVWLIGLPSVFALGLIAAVTEFVPYLGPIMAAIPAILVALTQSPDAALWTLGAYILIHQIEGNLITPLIQRWLIFIPPALMLLGIAAIGTLFGVAGVVFAGPIVVTLFVVVKKLYVRDTLGEKA